MTGYQAYQFIYNDTMSKGLTFNDDIVITIDGTTYTDYAKTVKKNDDGTKQYSIEANGDIETRLPKLFESTYIGFPNRYAIISYDGNLSL